MKAIAQPGEPWAALGRVQAAAWAACSAARSAWPPRQDAAAWAACKAAWEAACAACSWPDNPCRAGTCPEGQNRVVRHHAASWSSADRLCWLQPQPRASFPEAPLMSTPTPAADRNLVFGLLALQMDFVTREQ